MEDKPQIENGYIRVATELFEALTKIRIPGEARQIFDFILRKTYGFQKKEDQIALSQFCLATGMKKPAVVRAIRKCESMRLIVIKKDNGNINSYSIQKDSTHWISLSKKIILSKKITSVIKKDNLSLSKKIPTIDNTTKDNITINNTSISPIGNNLEIPKQKKKNEKKEKIEKTKLHLRIESECWDKKITFVCSPEGFIAIESLYHEEDISRQAAKACVWTHGKNLDSVLRLTRLQKFLEDFPQKNSSVPDRPRKHADGTIRSLTKAEYEQRLSDQRTKEALVKQEVHG